MIDNNQFLLFSLTDEETMESWRLYGNPDNRKGSLILFFLYSSF